MLESKTKKKACLILSKQSTLEFCFFKKLNYILRGKSKSQISSFLKLIENKKGAVHEKFNPSLIETEEDNPDILIVQCKLSNNYVRLINGYGPQESDPVSEKMKFFASFESAIQSAKLNGNLLCAELDANSKVGKENIQLDPHHISSNGQILIDIVKRNGLKTKVSEEKSVIDYYIVCAKFFCLIRSMEIDEERKYVLTKYSTRMGNQSICESDHNVLVCRLNIRWDTKTAVKRKEICHLKDFEGLRLFSENSSNTPKLVELSQHSNDILADSDKWLNQIEDIKRKSSKSRVRQFI